MKEFIKELKLKGMKASELAYVIAENQNELIGVNALSVITAIKLRKQ